MDDMDLKHAAWEILPAFGIKSEVLECGELLRYQYPEPDQMRLIFKATCADRAPLVIKLISERDHPRALMEEQSAFSEHLRKHGIPTARRYPAAQEYCAEIKIGGVCAVVTVEDFMANEITLIDGENIRKIGGMLARAHNIAAWDDCHVNGKTLFNALDRNDLFSYAYFVALKQRFAGEGSELFAEIQERGAKRLRGIERLRVRKMYATQGDVSDCNLFQTPDGQIGMFDFNNCGDNYLLSDAILEGIFVARLMDYVEPITEEAGRSLFLAFMDGYEEERSLTAEDMEIIPDLYAVTNAFWLGDLEYGEEALVKKLEIGEQEAVLTRLRSIVKTLNDPFPYH